MSELTRFERYLNSILPGFRGYDFRDKRYNISRQIQYMLSRTQSMFEWSGLPDSIPQRNLELYLQVNGNACIYKYNDTLYAFTGGLGGEPDVYYMPTIYTIANPALKLSVNAEIGKDCIVIPNDSMYTGLLPLFQRYATGMVETELSIWIASIQSRLVSLISAQDDVTKASADQYIADVFDGKLGVIGERKFFEDLKVSPFTTSGTSRAITELIELMQYQKASMFNEIGLNANYNMKRESINSGESQLNNDALLPLVDDMLKSRQVALEKVNSMFGTSISVSLNSSWEDNEIEIEKEQDEIEGGENDDSEETPETD